MMGNRGGDHSKKAQCATWFETPRERTNEKEGSGGRREGGGFSTFREDLKDNTTSR